MEKTLLKKYTTFATFYCKMALLQCFIEQMMTIPLEELTNIAALAYLEIDDKGRDQLALDLNNMMAFVQQLRQTNTENQRPLLHPLDLLQRLRTDDITEHNCLTQLAKIAPKFDDGLYLVPKVIDSGK